MTPALTLLLLGGRDTGPARPGSLAWLKRALRAGARAGSPTTRRRWARRRRSSVSRRSATLPFFGATFLPEFREGHYLVHMSAVPGTSLDESFRLGARVTEALKARPARPLGGAADRPGGAVARTPGARTTPSSRWTCVPLTGEAAETVAGRPARGSSRRSRA